MPAVEHINVIKYVTPNTLIDVGANKGQFSVVARHLYPDVRIHAFEPMRREGALCKRIVSGPFTFHAIALSDTIGRKQFFIASRTDSSSLLLPGSGQKTAFGVTKKLAMTVEVSRLDAVFSSQELTPPVLLKIDVQGGELNVLLGCGARLAEIDAVYVEASFVELYSGQPLATDITKFMIENGFKLCGVFNMVITKAYGPTQADFLFSQCRSHS